MLPVHANNQASVPVQRMHVPGVPTFIRDGIRVWCQDLPASEASQLSAQWTALHRAEAAAMQRNGNTTEPDTSANAIFRLLERVAQTPGAANDRATAVALLRAMAQDEGVRERWAAQARLGNADCHDNAIDQFETLRLQLPFQNARKVEDYVDAAYAKTVTDLLDAFVGREFPHNSEELEISRYLKCRLADRLGVSKSHMLYADFAEHAMGGEAKARATVERALRYLRRQGDIDHRIVKTLLDVPAWEEYLKKHYAPVLDICLDTVQDALAKAMDMEESKMRMPPRIAGLDNIFQSKQALALQRLTEVCVEVAREGRGQRIDVRAYVERRVREPAHARDVAAQVRARVTADARFLRIAEEAAVQADQWDLPTGILAERNWGRRASGGDDPARVDPIGEYYRHRLRPALVQAPADAEAGGRTTQLSPDPDEADLLTRALEASVRLASPTASPAASRRVPMPRQPARVGVDMVDSGEPPGGRIARLVLSLLLSDEGDLRANAGRLANGWMLQFLLTSSANIVMNDHERALACHACASLLDAARIMIKEGHLDGEAMFKAISRPVAGEPSPLQTIDRLIAQPAESSGALEIAQARLMTSEVFLLRRLAESMRDARTDGFARVRDALAARHLPVAGSDHPRPLRESLRALQLQGHALVPGVDPRDKERRFSLLVAARDRIDSIEDRDRRQAYSRTADLNEVLDRLFAAMSAEARRAQPPP